MKMEQFSHGPIITSRGPWKSERTRKIPALQGRTKEKKEKEGEEVGWGLQPLRDESEERSPYPGKPSLGGAQFGQKGEPHSLSGREQATSMWEQDRVRPAHRVLTPALPAALEHVHQ